MNPVFSDWTGSKSGATQLNHRLNVTTEYSHKSFLNFENRLFLAEITFVTTRRTTGIKPVTIPSARNLHLIFRIVFAARAARTNSIPIKSLNRRIL